MSFLNTLFEYDSLNRLTTLALTQLWQVTLLIIIVGFLVKIFCRHRPHVAYLLWLVVIAKCVTPPLWSSPTSPFSWALREPVIETVMIVPVKADPRPTMNRRELTRPKLPAVFDESEITIVAEHIAPIAPPAFEIKPHHIAMGCGIIWILGCSVVSIVICWKWLVYRRFLKISKTEVSADLQSQLTQLSRQLGVRRTARIECVDAACCPSLFGIFRPRIVLPKSIAEKSSADELEPILAHELIHIRRGDLAVASLQLLVQTLYWFHPLVWWANREMRRERERCCDEEVVAALNLEPKNYANLLVSLLESIKESRALFAPAGVTMFGFTKRRLEHLVRRGARFRARTPKLYWLIVLVAFAIVLPGSGLAQNKAVTKIIGDLSAAKRLDQDILSKLKQPIQIEYIEALDTTVVKGHPDDVALVTTDLQKEPPKKESSEPSTPKNSIQKDDAIDTFEGYVRGIDSVNIKSGEQDPESRLKAPVFEKLRKQGAEFTLHPDKNGKMFVTANLIPWKESDEGWKLLHEVKDLQGIAFTPANLKRESLQQLTTFPDLREYIIGNANDEQFATIPFSKKITGLMLQADAFTDKSLQKLAEYESLENLVVYMQQQDIVIGGKRPFVPPDITDAGIGSLVALKNLRTLSLAGLPKVSGVGLKDLADLRSLIELDLGLYSFDESGVKSLAKLTQLKKLNIRNAKLPSAGFAPLKELSNLEYLSMSSATNFDDQAAANLSALKKLRWLSLFGMRDSLTDNGLMAIKDLKQLQSFSLSITRTRPKIERYSLACLKNLTKLQYVNIDGLKLDDGSMENFKNLGDVRQLLLHDELNISDDSFKNLSQMKKLVTLDISSDQAQLTDDCLTHLKEMKEMLRLWIQGSKITGRGFKNLQEMKKLAWLLFDSKIEDQYIAELASLPKLEHLLLGNSQLTDKAVPDLVKLPLLSELDLKGSQLSDKGLAQLAKMKNLGYLGVQNTKITKSTVEQIRKQHPKLLIAFSESENNGAFFVGDLDGDTDGVIESKGPSAIREYSEEEVKELVKRSNGGTEDESKNDENKNAKPADEKKPEKTSSNDPVDNYDGAIRGLDSQRFDFQNNVSQERLNSPEFTELKKQGIQFTMRKDKHGKLFVVAHLTKWRESEAGWKQLVQIKDIQGLSILPRLFRKESYAHLNEFSSLRELIVSMADDEEFVAFPALKTLTGLEFSGTKFTDKCLNKLSEYKSVETLHISQFQEAKNPVPTVSEEGLAKLAELPNLRTLNIQGIHGTNGKFLSKLANLKNLHELEIRLPSIDDEGLKSLANLKQVKKLVIEASHATSVGWQSLKTMSSLEALTVMTSENFNDETMMGITQLKQLRYLAIPAVSDKLTGKGLATLKNLTELRTLFVGFDRMSATLHDLAFLADLKKLRKLTLHGVIVNDSSFDHLKELSDLRELTFISGPDLTDAAFQRIAHLKNLEVLHIDAPQLSDDCFVHLKDLTSLKRILLTGKNIQGKGLQHLSNQPNLLSIVLEESPIEDAYAKEFLKFPKLDRLFLRKTKFSDDAVEDLSRLPAMKDLHLTGSGISDKEVEKFARIKSLTSLDLRGSLVTEAGAEKLQKLNPRLGLIVKQTGPQVLIFHQ